MSTTPDAMIGWRLRDSNATPFFDPSGVDSSGTLGKPVIHRQGCQTKNRTHVADTRVEVSKSTVTYPRLDLFGFDAVQVLWDSEQFRRFIGQPESVQFCQLCVIEPDR